MGKSITLEILLKMSKEELGQIHCEDIMPADACWLLAEEVRKLKNENKDKERLDWLDQHTAFVADGEYIIGSYKIGELRKMADDGIAIDKLRRLK